MTIDKSSLSSLIDWWGLLEDLSTAIVFIGVVGESIAELTTLIKNAKWKRRIVVISTFSVIFGIAGELGCQHRLGGFNAQLVSIIEKEASDAQERAAQDELALAKFAAPRKISVDQRNRIVEKMKQFAPQEYFGRVSAGSDDAWDLWREISLILDLAGWKRVGPFPPVGTPPYGPPATISTAAMPGVMIWSWSGWDSESTASALAKALRDDGNGILAGHGGAIMNDEKIILIEIGPNSHLPASMYREHPTP